MNDTITLTLTTEQLNTIRNMVDFATWHAADCMFPAIGGDATYVNGEPVRYKGVAVEDLVESLYNVQRTLVIDARIALGLDAEGDYAD